MPLKVVVPEPLAMCDPVLHRTEPRGDDAKAVLSTMALLHQPDPASRNSKHAISLAFRIYKRSRAMTGWFHVLHSIAWNRASS